MALVAALATGQFCVFLIVFFVNKDMFLTNLNTNLYHVREPPLKNGYLNRFPIAEIHNCCT